MESTYDVLLENYLNQFKIDDVKNAHIARRGKYWFVDVELNNGEKFTRLRFATNEMAEAFYNYIYYNSPLQNKENKNWDWIAPAFITAVCLILLIIFSSID